MDMDNGHIAQVGEATKGYHIVFKERIYVGASK